METKKDDILVYVPTPEGRTYKVVVWRDFDKREQAHVVNFWCDVCYVKEAGDFRDLLRDNAHMNHGAFALRDDRIVIIDTQLETTADVEEVTAILFHIAMYSDMYKTKRSIAKGGKVKRPVKKPPEIGKMLGGPKEKHLMGKKKR